MGSGQRGSGSDSTPVLLAALFQAMPLLVPRGFPGAATPPAPTASAEP